MMVLKAAVANSSSFRHQDWKITFELLIASKHCVLVCSHVSPHHLGRLQVCVLCREVLQDLLVVTAVDVAAVNFQDDLARL